MRLAREPNLRSSVAVHKSSGKFPIHSEAAQRPDRRGESAPRGGGPKGREQPHAEASFDQLLNRLEFGVVGAAETLEKNLLDAGGEGPRRQHLVQSLFVFENGPGGQGVDG